MRVYIRFNFKNVSTAIDIIYDPVFICVAVHFYKSKNLCRKRAFLLKWLELRSAKEHNGVSKRCLKSLSVDFFFNSIEDYMDIKPDVN